MSVKIRNAKKEDIDGIIDLLRQIATLHHINRPDIFKPNSQKYTREQLSDILQDKNKPVFVAVDETGALTGYAFCIIVHNKPGEVCNGFVSLYIDDLCVDERLRGQGIGRMLFEAVKEFAKQIGAYSVNLNVWEFNQSAISFYESCGMTTQRRIMELIL